MGQTINNSRNPRLHAVGGGWSAVPSGVTEDGFIIAAKHLDKENGVGTCGHPHPTVALVAGCPDEHVWSWLACRECQIGSMRTLKEYPGNTYLACGHLCFDFIYSYLPDDTHYGISGGKTFGLGSVAID